MKKLSGIVMTFVPQRNWAANIRYPQISRDCPGVATLGLTRNESSFPLPQVHLPRPSETCWSDTGSRDFEVGPPGAVAEARPARPGPKASKMTPVGWRLGASVSSLLGALASFPIQQGESTYPGWSSLNENER